MLLPSILAIVLGFGLLIWSADRFVFGAAAIARNLGMSTLMIGMTIVALGTSAPEILVAIMAALDDSTGLAIGNALGSNIANIGLVLGVTAIIAPIAVAPKVQRKEIPVLVIVTVLVGVLLSNDYLGMWDGIVLLLALSLLIAALIYQARYGVSELPDELIDDLPDVAHTPINNALMWFFTALLLLLASSRMLVWGASNVARVMGVDEVIIGLSIVAIGTSLPELAACLAGALKKQNDIALGNVVGSNILNMLTVMPVPALLRAGPIGEGVFWRDYGLMFGFTAILVIALFVVGVRGILHRWQGMLFTSLYLGYLYFLYINSQG